jgi:phosphate:Na+ symporter
VLEVFFLSCLGSQNLDIAYFLFFGFGLLFIGLSFMKTSMEAQVKVLIFVCFDVIGRFLIGFIITVLVQSVR